MQNRNRKDSSFFSIPILQNLSKNKIPNKHIKALILTPTRELAIQIEENINAYGKYLPLKQLVIFGGVKQGNQEAALRKGVDILVATREDFWILLHKESSA